jgi:rubrerythrin
MGDTKNNLASAFAGESQANRRYLAFAKKAKEDGYPNLAKLFKAAAAAETIHAHNHLRVMRGIGSTVENVEEAISGETHEFKEMYPGFLATAKEAGESQAVWSFDVALQVEKVHAKLYEGAKAAMEAGKDLETEKFWVCKVCGNTFENEHPEKCPICNATEFKEI